MLRCGTAATADHVDPPLGRKVSDKGRHLGSRLVIAAKRIRQAGVRVAADVAVGDIGELLDVGPHLGGPEGAVDTNGQGLGVAHGIPEGLHGLTREGAARGVGDRDRENDRPAHAAPLKDLLTRKDRRLEVQRVKDCLQQQQVNPSVK